MGLLLIDTARFFRLYHILHFKWQPLHFQTFWSDLQCLSCINTNSVFMFSAQNLVYHPV
jgi:hypothetical protein